MFYRVSAIYMGKHFVFMAEFIISFCCAFFHLISYLQHYNLEVARDTTMDVHSTSELTNQSASNRRNLQCFLQQNTSTSPIYKSLLLVTL